jgi:aminoglycoside phosphotransferase (APT) family kinase protein
MYWLEEDRDIMGCTFYVMGRIPGTIASSNPPYHAAGLVFDATPERRKKLGLGAIEAMATIHQLDWENLGFAFLGTPAPGTTQSIDWELDYYERVLNWARQEEQPVLAAALDYLRANKPNVENLSICWGDPRMQNIVFGKDDTVVAVLDWEMAFLGDPEADLAWFLLADWQASEGYGIPHTEGFPTREEMIKSWESLMDREVRNILYYDVMSAFKYGIVMMKAAKNLKAIGFLPEDHDMDLNNPATRRLASLLELSRPGD